MFSCVLDHADGKQSATVRKRKLESNTRCNGIRRTVYRPFVEQCCYVDYTLANRKYQIDRTFLTAGTDNKPFRAVTTDDIPETHFMPSGTQCFPRYHFPKPNVGVFTLADLEVQAERIDDISGTVPATLRAHYSDEAIDKDTILDYDQ